MFKNMKLAAKIGVGFALVILIAITLGSLAVWKMTGVKDAATALGDDYIPGARISNEVERDSLKTMYAMRGYAYTEDAKYWDEMVKSLGEVKDDIKKAAELAAKSSNLDELKKDAASAGAKVEEYEKLANETKAKTEIALKDEAEMNADAEKYMKEAYAYLASQTEKMDSDVKAVSELKVAGLEQTVLDKLAKDIAGRNEKITRANEIIDCGNAARIGVWTAIAKRDPQGFQAAIKSLDKVEGIVDKLLENTSQQVNRDQLAAVKNAGKMYDNAGEEFLAAWLAREELNKRRGEVATAVLDAAQNAAQDSLKASDDIADASTANLISASWTMVIGLAIGTVIGIFLAVFITRSITGPIHRIIAGLTEGSEQVASAAGQVSSASQSLAQGATEQAAGLEETSSSLEEMSAMTKQNADNAQQANVLAAEAKKTANSGAEAMSRMSTAITEIQKSSDETAKIIKVIDEIAFQTNLLALNAAVEAARAGEAGKGFAVVAEEVRNLAMRSAEAAKNTSAMIEGSVKNSKNGVDIAAEVGKVLTEIVGSIGKTTDLVAEIAAASQEQARGVDQVNTAVGQMDKVTQQNAANAEESASASEELSAQAASMKEIVGELVMLVGGSSNSNESNSYQHKAVQTAGLSAVHAVADSKSEKPLRRRKTSNTHSAETAIPMSSQAELDSFNN